jgi:hypothetical protein
MHFEHLILAPLTRTRTVEAWSEDVQREISAVTGDDAAMAVMAVGADLADLRALYTPRVGVLEQQFTAPIDELGRSVERAEHELQRLRQRQLDETQQLWAHYKPGYERYLHAAPEPEPEPEDRDLEGPDPAVPPSADEGEATPAAEAGPDTLPHRDEPVTDGEAAS